MKAGISIRFENTSYASEAIAKLTSIEELPGFQSLSHYAQQTLSFCHAWLHNQAFFEMQTSGSTGKPKNIQITRAQMLASAKATAEALGLEAGDQALVCLNTAYIAGKMMLVRGMETGMPLIIVPPSSSPLETIEAQVDFTALVPLQLKNMLQTEEQRYKAGLNAMKAILVGGAPVDDVLERLIQKNLSVPVFSTYGMTETVSHIALRKLNGPDASDTYKVLPGIEIRTDARNCLSIRGTVSNHQWIQTHDIVALLDTTHFRWLGRADNVVNSGGHKIYIETIEKNLQKIIHDIGLNNRFFLAGLPDKKLGERLCLIIEQEGELDKREASALKKWMEAHLHPYEIPKNIICLPEFILTPTGKIQRKHTVALVEDVFE